MKKIYKIMMLIILASLFIVIFVLKINIPCIFKTVIGIPCPTCGLTRATFSIIEGKILESFYYNIMAIPMLLFLSVGCIFIVLDIILNKNKFEEVFLKFFQNKLITYICLSLIICSFIYNVLKNMLN